MFISVGKPFPHIHVEQTNKIAIHIFLLFRYCYRLYCVHDTSMLICKLSEKKISMHLKLYENIEYILFSALNSFESEYCDANLLKAIEYSMLNFNETV